MTTVSATALSATNPNENDEDDDEGEFECPICFAAARHMVHFLPCKHEFCETCAVSVLPKKYDPMRCPVCRQGVCGVTSLATHGVVEPSPLRKGGSPKRRRRMVFTFSPSREHHMGVTLRNLRERVVVKRLESTDEGARLLKVGDEISHINGIPVFTHQAAVRAIDVATEHTLPLVLVVKRLSPEENSSFVAQAIQKMTRCFKGPQWTRSIVTPTH